MVGLGHCYCIERCYYHCCCYFRKPIRLCKFISIWYSLIYNNPWIIMSIEQLNSIGHWKHNKCPSFGVYHWRNEKMRTKKKCENLIYINLIIRVAIFFYWYSFVSIDAIVVNLYCEMRSKWKQFLNGCRLNKPK